MVIIKIEDKKFLLIAAIFHLDISCRLFEKLVEVMIFRRFKPLLISFAYKRLSISLQLIFIYC